MEVFIERENKTISVDFEGKGSDLLRSLGVNLETVLLIRNEELVSSEDFLDKNDNVKIISVISGG